MPPPTKFLSGCVWSVIHVSCVVLPLLPMPFVAHTSSHRSATSWQVQAIGRHFKPLRPPSLPLWPWSFFFYGSLHAHIVYDAMYVDIPDTYMCVSGLLLAICKGATLIRGPHKQLGLHKKTILGLSSLSSLQLASVLALLLLERLCLFILGRCEYRRGTSLIYIWCQSNVKHRSISPLMW